MSKITGDIFDRNTGGNMGGYAENDQAKAIGRLADAMERIADALEDAFRVGGALNQGPFTKNRV